MRKKIALTTCAFLNAPHKEWSESLKTILNELGENDDVDV